eukprot:jgi/Botrbrau1/9265/Bobra.180_1s0022.1
MPRVPSLDLLRQLVAHQNTSANPAQNLPCSTAEAHEDDVSSSKLEALTSTSAPPPQIVATVPVVAPVALSNSLVPKAVAMPTHPLAVHHSQATSGSDIVIDKEKMSKAEYRRARRMLSNRESARRSRKRKQEHLMSLEEQMHKVQEEKQHVDDRVAKLEKEIEKRDAENRKLKEEILYLKEQLIKAGDGDYALKVREAVRKGPRSDLPKRVPLNGRHEKMVKREAKLAIAAELVGA